MQKQFHHLILGISVLPALLVLPAWGDGITNINEAYEAGTKIVYTDGSKVSLTLPELIINNKTWVDISATNGSNIYIGDENTRMVDLTGTRGIQVFYEDSLVNVKSDGLKINAVDYGLLASTGTLGIDAKNIDITSGLRAVQAQAGAIVDVVAETLNMNDAIHGVIAFGVSNVNIDASKSIDITSTQESLYVSGDGTNVNLGTKSGATKIILNGVKEAAGGDSFYSTVLAVDKGVLYLGNEKADITINGDEDTTVWAFKGGQVNINGKDVKINSTNSYSVWAQNNTTDASNPSRSNLSTVNIAADRVDITAVKGAIVAMSQGVINISGDSTISAKDAILARGDAHVTVNESGKNTVKMDGNIDFNYHDKTSKTSIDAVINVTLAGADSYWTGNTVTAYDKRPTEAKLKISNATINIKDGAVWNATTISDKTGDTNGYYYVPLNKLNINNGMVNIADTDRGITVDYANIADATFTGGMFNIGNELNVAGGTNVFDSDILGNTLTIASGAIANINGNIDVSTITLDGTMVAELNAGDDARITAETFDGNGELALTLRGDGEYRVFGNAVFASDNINVTSGIYDIVWNDGKDTITATLKSIEDIAKDNELSSESAQMVVNLTKSTSEQLNELSVLLQEQLALGNTDTVELVNDTINPETTSVVQSVTTSVQNTVASVAAGRMALPTLGRSGGDVDITAHGAWAQGLYNKSKMNDAFDGHTWGVAAGYDLTLNKHTTIGAGYAFSQSDIDATERDIDIDSHTIFVYGQYKPSQWYINTTLNYTMSKYQESGDVLGVTVDSDYDVNAFGAQIMTGYDFASGVTPEIGLRYLHVSTDDYTSSLGITNTIDDTNFLTAVLGTKYVFDIRANDNLMFRPELRYAVKMDIISDKMAATVAMPGVDAYALNAERMSRIGNEFGIGLGVVYRGLNMSVNYEIDVREDYTSQTGMVRARYNF
ncbi:MAG: autotransporter domain-containing protein [Alphaproteobacteria bacterium]|nr:autotransporter domain-containing protein [Alphaproteobacteria bacterium]